MSAQLFIFTSEVQPLTLLKEIPVSIQKLFDQDDRLSQCVQDAERQVAAVNEILKPYLHRIHEFTYSKSKKDKMIPYAPFKVDEPPVIHTAPFEQIKASDIIAAQGITPVRHTKEFTYKGNCPWCGASSDYLYPNNHGRQYLCKVCHHTFTDKVSPRDKSGFYCPHCGRRLSAVHVRSGYVVYACMNRRCSYYLENKRRQDKFPDDPELITVSKKYRYRYHYREFTFNMEEVRSACKSFHTKVNLTRIHADQHTLGLILTYVINYGVSARKAANLMRDVHGIRISAQTILNYLSAVSSVVRNMVDNYPYELGSTQCGDETYVHIRGRNNYVYFFSDPIKKIITSYTIYKNRDTRNAVLSIYNVLRKFHNGLPGDLNFVTDANPIYNAAQIFFMMNGFNWDLHQVVGVKNKDSISREYRPIKQTEERLNKTFKENYYPMYGFNSLEKANQYMVLYVAFFNFLRRHSSLNYKPPVQLKELSSAGLMPDKWLKLIDMASEYNHE